MMSGNPLPPAPPRTSSRQSKGNVNPVGVNVSGNAVGSPFGTTAPFHPAGDAQTYRDLLIFEERLKQNAARLVKRKKKYQTFLVLVCGVIGVFSYNVFLHPSTWQPLHYFNVTVLLITATMLLLFFASGMFAERITAANKFVPQANRSLRSYNLYLNTRTAPRRSLISFLRPTPPSRTNTQSASAPSADEEAGNHAGGVRMQRVPSSEKRIGGAAAARRLHISAIPPSSNPRGELIFGSKVSPAFREGYERYRAAFERRRREKMDERRKSGWRRWWTMFDFVGSDTTSPGAPNSMEKGTPVMSHRSSPAPSLSRATGASGGGGRSSPRSSRMRSRMNSASGSENSSPNSSRASSPTSSPKVAGVLTLPDASSSRSTSSSGGGGGGGASTRRGRQTTTSNRTTHDQLTDAVGGASDVRRGRDRTPSITAVSDERLVQRAGTSTKSADLSVHRDDHTIAEEARPNDFAPPPQPNSALVADQTDDRSDVEATLREPST